MKLYLINLKQNHNRLLSMQEQLAQIPVEVERIDAVYGKSLTAQERKMYFARVHSFFAMMRCLTDGELGCALSHIKAYESMIAANVPYAIVAEDDIQIRADAKDIIDQALREIDVRKPIVVLLSALGVRAIREHRRGLERIPSGMGTEMYLITLPAARAILKSNYPVVTVSDQWNRWTRRRRILLYRMWPIIAVQRREDFGTEIGQAFRPWPGVLRYLYKALRVVGMVVDEVWYWALENRKCHAES